ncbi:MAG: DUF488 domain-containing protein [Bacteroidales bacterium]|jgi:uncharacterized protein (DUF488 family)|nr:DUF488 domain-containing protein [Bacteroidales bacterium]
MKSTLYSIGHGTKTIDEFCNELNSFNITYLVDVRSKPYSKWNPNFNQDILKYLSSKRKIIYVYMGDVIGGIPNDMSCYTDGHIDYKKMGEKQSFIDGLNRLIIANKKGIKLAVMCSESDPTMCHRSKLIGEELSKKGIQMKHIIAVNKYKTQTDIINAITKGNGLNNLFGEEVLISRKAYI